ncbi:metal-dependent hydrolase [Pseudodesulfovibrio piezophilus]|uniref:Membrane-bound metal-dependent hydrolase n=1 Tax=Pseudodesulfovibrio piezophilus (strain DSM 21447 / JCM 15486 / C1TLV30) TaxID=1322246 RepID=M1WNK7_PSEP2|nr:metal-dependent hydrolase [Pseudodesulfovibrio piezophilus]CCH47649.1 Membrane-bound metal-dependent hydrolase [Pseudodesulfovibrio piezophilus C1TLV30]
MPGYKGHLAGGLFFAVMGLVGVTLLGWLLLTPLLALGLIGFCLLGALFPDVDTDSKGQRLYYLIFAIVDLGFILQQHYLWASWLGLFAMLPPMGSHRGWTHTWWAMVVVPLPIIVVPAVILGGEGLKLFVLFYVAFVVGYFSHLLLDCEFC